MASKKIFEIQRENRFHLDDNFIQNYAGQQPQWGPVGYVTYKRTYARPITIVDSPTPVSEEFWQTSRRVIEGAFSILKQHIRRAHQPWNEAEAQEKAQEMFRRMWAFKFLPPGRGLWFMGTPALELIGSAALNNCGFVSTNSIIQDFAEPFCMMMDYLMLGVGMGFDDLGAGKVALLEPSSVIHGHVVEDSREGWIALVRNVLFAFATGGALFVEPDYSKIRLEGAPLKTFGGTASGPQPLIDLYKGLVKLCWLYVGRAVDSAFIVDVMNLIGRCVVAGNVRRSSEIALGDPRNDQFLNLKDPTELNLLIAKQEQRLALLPECVKIQEMMSAWLVSVVDLPALDQRRVNVQAEIRTLRARLHNLAMEDPEYAEYEHLIAAHPLRTHRWASNNTVLCELGTDYAPLVERTLKNGEPGFGWLKTLQQYGRLVDHPNGRDHKARGFNPCGEQSLWDRELCCLVETFPTNHEDLDDYLTTLKYAYLYAKIVTLVPTHNEATNAVLTRNRRIGTSMAGVIEMYARLGMRECIRWWDTGYRYLRELDAEYSGWMGVGESIKITSIKPGGTVPLLPGIEGGMKAPSSEYYFRTIRIDHTSPIVEAHRRAGYRVEKDLTTPRTMVVYFPVHNTRCERTADTLSLWEQALIFTNLQRYWADNMVSATLTFQPHEQDDVLRVLQAFEGQWKSVSFLPLSSHGYVQAPYIPCTKEEYEQAVAGLAPVDFTGVGHEFDEKYCSGGVCELPVN